MDVGVCIFPIFQKPAYCSYPEQRLITIKKPVLQTNASRTGFSEYEVRPMITYA